MGHSFLLGSSICSLFFFFTPGISVCDITITIWWYIVFRAYCLAVCLHLIYLSNESFKCVCTYMFTLTIYLILVFIAHLIAF